MDELAHQHSTISSDMQFLGFFINVASNILAQTFESHYVLKIFIYLSRVLANCLQIFKNEFCRLISF